MVSRFSSATKLRQGEPASLARRILLAFGGAALALSLTACSAAIPDIDQMVSDAASSLEDAAGDATNGDAADAGASDAAKEDIFAAKNEGFVMAYTWNDTPETLFIQTAPDSEYTNAGKPIAIVITSGGDGKSFTYVVQNQFDSDPFAGFESAYDSATDWNLMDNTFTWSALGYDYQIKVDDQKRFSFARYEYDGEFVEMNVDYGSAAIEKVLGAKFLKDVTAAVMKSDYGVITGTTSDNFKSWETFSY